MNALFRRVNELRAIRSQGSAAVEAYRREQLTRVIAHAQDNAPFYRRLYRGINPASCKLTDLPVTRKELLMNHFDEAVTDPRLNMTGVLDWLEKPVGHSDYYMGNHVLLRSSGTTGHNGYFVYTRAEFQEVLAHVFLGTPSGGESRISNLAYTLLPGVRIRTAMVTHPSVLTHK